MDVVVFVGSAWNFFGYVLFEVRAADYRRMFGGYSGCGGCNVWGVVWRWGAQARGVHREWGIVGCSAQTVHHLLKFLFSFLWSQKQEGGPVKVFKWTGKNDYVRLCESDFISFGGG